ncbi:MAG: glutamate--cysteine ligase, partial [Alphaproteobacteria bacterium]|nr:glutamate--cysteine ligase [Alphaproteobacteria bacterium]
MASSPVITSKQQLVDYIQSGEKPKDQWRIGTEHEKFLYDRASQKRVGYFGPKGIEALLQRLQQQTNWQPIWEGKYIIGLTGTAGDSVTLEPGGQLELSGAPLINLHETCAETNRHLELILGLCKEFDIQMFGLGHDPLHNPDSIEWMPKGRYVLMRRYMPTRGGRGTEMMTQTCTVQANLDFSSEPDMVKKFRASLALQPLVSALFANSPLMNGRLTDQQTTRVATWQDTDPDRTGFPALVFDDGFGYEQWVDYMLRVPMYFVKDYGPNHASDHQVIYRDALGKDFRQFMAGQLAEFKDRPATVKDWEDHLSVVFTEVRLKRYLEMRGADVGQWQHLCALPAFWVGLLYDQSSLDAAYDLIAKWRVDDMVDLARRVPKEGIRAKMGKFTLLDYGREALIIAEQGLKKRAVRNRLGSDETIFLEFVREIITSKQSSSDLIIARINNEFGGDVAAFV